MFMYITCHYPHTMGTNGYEGESGVTEEICSGSQGRANVLDLREEEGYPWGGKVWNAYMPHIPSFPTGRYQFDFIYQSKFPQFHLQVSNERLPRVKSHA